MLYVKKWIGILLLAGLLLQTAGCTGTDSSGDDTEADTSSHTETTAVTTEAETVYEVQAVNYDGQTVTVMAADGGSSSSFPFYEILAEESSGETMNDAVYERNGIIEEKYNVDIAVLQIKAGSGPAVQQYTQEAASSSHAFDFALTNPVDTFKSAISGYLYPIDQLPVIDTGRSHWL